MSSSPSCALARPHYEQAADQVAAQVERGIHAPAIQSHPQQPLVQRFTNVPSAGIAVAPSVKAGIRVIG